MALGLSPSPESKTFREREKRETMRDEILRMLHERLAADVRADEWDEPPSLSLILMGSSGTVIIEPMPITQEIWNLGPVHRVLDIVAEVTRSAAESGWQWLEEGQSFLGIFLFSEGWAVSSTIEADDLPRIQEYMAAGGRLADHPAGVECKMISALLTDGSSLHLTHFRNGETIGPKDGEETGHEVAGRVPDGLSAVLAAFTGAGS